MSTYKIVSDKLSRLLSFLRGCGNARVGAHLRKLGFTQADLDEGWALLREASGGRLAVHADGGEPDPKVVAAIDDFENRWYPIVSATLARRWPALAADVFLNLAQTEGPAVAVTVQTLLDRLAKMPGADGTAARALLAQRGLDDQAIAGVKELLAQMGTLGEAPAHDPEADRKERDAAEDRAWQWYLEWSQIAQAGISNGQVLQRLGYQLGGNQRQTEQAAPAPAASDGE